MNKHLIVIAGPTGIGKTSLGIKIAKYFDTVILSADTRQMYMEMKIGTAVPSEEELQRVKHYFIHNLSVSDYYNASKFEQEAKKLLRNIYLKKDVALLVGGSGLYINAVCNGIDDLPEPDQQLRKDLTEKYNNEGIESIRKDLKKLDPEYYKKVDLRNHKRILKALEITLMTGKPYSAFLTHQKKPAFFNVIKIGLNCDRDKLYDKINRRVDNMITHGLEKEARKLYIQRHENALKTVGYREFFSYFNKNCSFDEAVELIKRNTRHYARRQITWFAKDKEIKWFSPGDEQIIIRYIKSKIKA